MLISIHTAPHSCPESSSEEQTRERARKHNRLRHDRMGKIECYLQDGPDVKGVTIQPLTKDVRADLDALGFTHSWCRKAQDRAGG